MDGINAPQLAWWKNTGRLKRKDRGLADAFYLHEYVECPYPDRWFPSYVITSYGLPQQFAKRRRMDAYKNP